ncbi:hypothetical protein Hanom_Chr06g00521451 [Helianthus anomalus]
MPSSKRLIQQTTDQVAGFRKQHKIEIANRITRLCHRLLFLSNSKPNDNGFRLLNYALHRLQALPFLQQQQPSARQIYLFSPAISRSNQQ